MKNSKKIRSNKKNKNLNLSENEIKYYDSINKNKKKYNFKNLKNKYVNIEETNDRLKKLIFNLCMNKDNKVDINNNKKNLYSIDKTFSKNKCIYDPEYNFIGLKSKYNCENEIQNRSKNIKIINRHKKFENENNFIFKSKIRNIPGSNTFKNWKFKSKWNHNYKSKPQSIYNSEKSCNTELNKI